MRQQEDPLYKLLQELNTWKSKIEELEEQVRNRPNGILARDLARRAAKILENGAKKMRAVERMASKQQERR